MVCLTIIGSHMLIMVIWTMEMFYYTLQAQLVTVVVDTKLSHASAAISISLCSTLTTCSLVFTKLSVNVNQDKQSKPTVSLYTVVWI